MESAPRNDFVDQEVGDAPTFVVVSNAMSNLIPSARHFLESFKLFAWLPPGSIPRANYGCRFDAGGRGDHAEGGGRLWLSVPPRVTA